MLTPFVRSRGIYIHGIFMDGAGWDYDDMVITDQEFGVMYVKAPIIHMIPWKDYIILHYTMLYNTTLYYNML